jgi:hypothetical protein
MNLYRTAILFFICWILIQAHGVAAQIPISTLEELDAIRNDLSGDYILVNDIDASPTALASYNNGQGWEPVGDATTPFNGSINGNGFEINTLLIDREDSLDIGLFGVVSSNSTVSNLKITNCRIEGRFYVGGIAGRSYGNLLGCSVTGTIDGNSLLGGVVGESRGTLKNCFSNVTIDANNSIGGIAGYVRGDIENCQSIVTITANSFLGGIVGEMHGNINYCNAQVIINGNNDIGGCVGQIVGDIYDSYSTGVLGGNNHVGGLAGDIRGDIKRCYSLVEVNGSYTIGGLVGECVGAIRSSYSSGNVRESFGSTDTPLLDTGGFVGRHTGDISDCFALGDVSGPLDVGGFIGNLTSGTISNCFSIGNVQGNIPRGGFASESAGLIEDSYWNLETSGLLNSAGATSRTTAQMTFPHNGDTYLDWDFTQIWDIGNATYQNNGYPFHRWQSKRIEIGYITDGNGSIVGEKQQVRIPGANGLEVMAVPNNGFTFLRWNDGSTNNPRKETNITSDLLIIAEFKAEFTDVPSDIIRTY